MKGVKRREWKEVPGCPDYFIDAQGVLIDADWNYYSPSLEPEKQDAFYTVRGKKLWVRELVKKLFGKDLNVDGRWKAAVERRTPAAFRRRCHDCGKLTTNYRCAECWRKLRQKHGELSEPPDAYRVLLHKPPR